MGTRSETVVFDNFSGKETPLCVIYRQMDGYPTAQGLELAKLCNVRIVNGIGIDNKNIANGMGCLAAQIIKGLKDGPGGIYMQNPLVPADEEYVYEVRGEVGSLPVIKCMSHGAVVFELPADRAIAFCEDYRDC